MAEFIEPQVGHMVCSGFFSSTGDEATGVCQADCQADVSTAGAEAETGVDSTLFTGS